MRSARSAHTKRTLIGALLLGAVALAAMLLRGNRAALPVGDDAAMQSAAWDGVSGGAVSDASERDTDGEDARRVADGAGEEHAVERAATTVVVRHADGSPAAAAEVRFWPSRVRGRRPADQRTPDDKEDLEVALAASGRSARTDAAGRAQVTTVDGPLCARSGDEYGEWRDDDRLAGEVTIVLGRDVTLRVQVVDDGGRPAPGRMVLAGAEYLDRDDGERGDKYLEFGPTDQDGMAALPHMQARIPLPGASILDWSMYVCCAGPEAASGRQDVRPDRLGGAAPIRLVVPSGGTVEVEVVDEAGAPCRTRPFLDSDDGERWTAASSTANHYHFCGVPIGRAWRVLAYQNRSGEGKLSPVEGRLDIAGPLSVEDVVRVRLVVPCTIWTLTGEVRRKDGLGPDSWRLGWRTMVVARDGTTRVCEGRSGMVRDGRLRLFLSTESAQELRDLTLQTATSETSIWKVSVAGPIVPERQDLGVLDAVPEGSSQLLAAVTVTFGGADVTASARVMLFASNGKRVEQIATTARVQDGVLLVHGVPPRGAMQIICRHEGALSHRESIQPGSRVDVRLDPAATLAVRIDDPWLPRTAVGVGLDSLDDPDNMDIGGDAQRSYGQAHRLFSWDALRPGRYRLHVEYCNERVFERELPPLVAGANVWPPDGSAIDLRKAPRVVLARLVGADGARLGGDGQWLVVPAGVEDVPGDFMEKRMSWDLATILLSAPRDLLVAAPGHVAVRVRVPPEDFRVALARATTVVVSSREPNVRVTFAYELPGPADPLLRAFDALVADRPTDFLFEDDTVEFSLPPGSDLVLQKLRGDQAGPPLRVRIGAVSPQEVVVQ